MPSIRDCHAVGSLLFGCEFTVSHLDAQPRADVLVMGGRGSISLYATILKAAACAGRVVYCFTHIGRLEIAAVLRAEVVEGLHPNSASQFALVVDASANAETLRCAPLSIADRFSDVSLPFFAMYQRGVRFYTGRGRGESNVTAALSWVAEGKVRPQSIQVVVALFDDAIHVLSDHTLKTVLVK